MRKYLILLLLAVSFSSAVHAEQLPNKSVFGTLPEVPIPARHDFTALPGPLNLLLRSQVMQQVVVNTPKAASGGGSFTVPPTNNGTNDTGGSSPNPIICGSVGSPAGCTNSNFSISAVNDTLVVLVVLNGGPSGTKTITDTCGNTWTAGPSNTGEGDFTYYTSSNCSGADTITVSGTWVSGNYNILFAADFNHQYTGIDATATQSFSGSGATCTGTFNTAVAGELVVGFCDNSGGVTSGGGGMTIVAQGTHNTAAWGDMVQATATSITPTIGHSGGNWWFQILAFKP